MIETIALNLTRDELIVFLATIGLSTMDGLDDDPLAGMDEREAAERLNSGEQSLVHRRLMEFQDEHHVILDDTLVALVGASAIPDASLLLTTVRPDGTNDSHFFNATSELLVEHHSPRAGIHAFDYLASPEGLRDRVRSLLSQLDHLPAPAEKMSQLIPPGALSAFVEACQGQEAGAARSALTEAGVSKEWAAEITGDYMGSPSIVGVVGWGLRNELPGGGDSTMVILGEGRCWLLENLAGDNTWVSVRLTGGVECQEALLALLHPLEAALVQSRFDPWLC